MTRVPRINARRWYLYALVCVWVIMGIISLGMIIAGKAKLFPDIAVVYAVLGGLTIFQLVVLFVAGWVSRLLNRGVDQAFRAFEDQDE